MAAPCRRLLRSAVKVLQCFSRQNLCLNTVRVPRLTCSRPEPCVVQPRQVLSSHSRTYTRQTTDWEKNQEQDGEEDSGPEYIPKKKAKNPMKVIGYAWMIGLPSGIIGFILAKKQVDKNRLQQLKIRQRMKKSNEGEYEHERFKPTAGVQ